MIAPGVQVRVKSTGEPGEVVTAPDALGMVLVEFTDGHRRPILAADLQVIA